MHFNLFIVIWSLLFLSFNSWPNAMKFRHRHQFLLMGHAVSQHAKISQHCKNGRWLRPVFCHHVPVSTNLSFWMWTPQFRWFSLERSEVRFFLSCSRTSMKRGRSRSTFVVTSAQKCKRSDICRLFLKTHKNQANNKNKQEVSSSPEQP